jgi:hypothetical protein
MSRAARARRLRFPRSPVKSSSSVVSLACTLALASWRARFLPEKMTSIFSPDRRYLGCSPPFTSSCRASKILAISRSRASPRFFCASRIFPSSAPPAARKSRWEW